MHFPLFRFPPYFRKNSDYVENFHNFTFPRKILRFSSTKVSEDPILVIDQKFLPSFPCICSLHSPVSPKLLFPPILLQISPLFSKNSRVFYILSVYFIPPTLTMMHLCITQCTYWTPLSSPQTHEYAYRSTSYRIMGTPGNSRDSRDPKFPLGISEFP